MKSNCVDRGGRFEQGVSRVESFVVVTGGSMIPVLEKSTGIGKVIDNQNGYFRV